MKLKANGIRGLGIQTDSIIFEPKHENKVKKLFDLTDKIGCYKIEFNKDLRGDVFVKFADKEPEIKELVIKAHDIKDEFDKVEINNVISNSKSMLLLGELPGVGNNNRV